MSRALVHITRAITFTGKPGLSPGGLPKEQRRQFHHGWGFNNEKEEAVIAHTIVTQLFGFDYKPATEKAEANLVKRQQGCDG